MLTARRCVAISQDLTANAPVASTGQCSLTLMAVMTVKRMFQLGILDISKSSNTGCAEILSVLQKVLQNVQPQEQPANWRIVMEIKV